MRSAETVDRCGRKFTSTCVYVIITPGCISSMRATIPPASSVRPPFGLSQMRSCHLADQMIHCLQTCFISDSPIQGRLHVCGQGLFLPSRPCCSSSSSFPERERTESLGLINERKFAQTSDEWPMDGGDFPLERRRRRRNHIYGLPEATRGNKQRAHFSDQICCFRLLGRRKRGRKRCAADYLISPLPSSRFPKSTHTERVVTTTTTKASSYVCSSSWRFSIMQCIRRASSSFPHKHNSQKKRT